MATVQERLEAASAFLLQSPPGEVNDVFADIRTLVAADHELEHAILPALKRYNQDQLTVVDLPSGSKGLVAPVSRLEGDPESDGPEERHVDPRGQQSFVFDHMKVTASSPLPLPVDPDTESLRAQLDTLLAAYVQNHYADGVAAVYALADPAYPAPAPSQPAPAPAPEEEKNVGGGEPHGEGETGELAAGVEGSTEDVAEAAAETAEQAEAALPTDEGEVAQGGSTAETVEGEEEGEDKMKIGTPAAEAAELPAEEEEGEGEKEEEKPAPVEEETKAEESEPEPTARPSRLFGLYFVGNKYNPGNYWTGRWRATYDLDYEKGTLEGTAQIQVHYYEQGNVQLTTRLTSTTPLPAQPPAEAVVAAVKASEASFQRQLASTYASLSDEGFRGLRRALPKTKAKINWEAVGGMRIGKAIGGGGGQ